MAHTNKIVPFSETISPSIGKDMAVELQKIARQTVLRKKTNHSPQTAVFRSNKGVLLVNENSFVVRPLAGGM
jgi:hypothetical protein